MLKLSIKEEAMYLSVFYSSICSCLCREFHTRVNEFKQKVFYLTEAKESHFFVLYWLINERSTDNATEIEKLYLPTLTP